MNNKRSYSSLLMMAALTTTFLAFPAMAQPREEEPMMKTYQENRIEDFRHYAEQADNTTLEQYLEMAVDHQRMEFADILLGQMPDDWNADYLAEKMLNRRNHHSLQYLMPYTSPSRHASWLDTAVADGDADIAALLYQAVPEADHEVLAERAYQNIKSARNRFVSARHIAVFDVFRPELTEAQLADYYRQAVRDRKTDFAKYLQQQK